MTMHFKKQRKIRNQVHDILQQSVPDHVELAILFGSYARNQAGRSSDVDIFMVTENIDSWTVKKGAVFNIGWSEDLPDPHFVICPPDEFKERWKEGDNMVETMLNEGFDIIGTRNSFKKEIDFFK